MTISSEKKSTFTPTRRRRSLAIDESSRACGHDYLMLAADVEARAVIFVTEGRDFDTVGQLAAELRAFGGNPEQIESCIIDMSPAFIRGATGHLPNTQITFHKCHVVAEASQGVGRTGRVEQRTDPALKGMRWKLLRAPTSLYPSARQELNALVRPVTSLRTVRAWQYREQPRQILQRKQTNVVRRMLLQWRTNVMRLKVDAMKAVAKMIRRHFGGIVAWVKTGQTNGFLEGLNGVFQAAKRKARAYIRVRASRLVIFLLAGKRDFRAISPHVHA